MHSSCSNQPPGLGWEAGRSCQINCTGGTPCRGWPPMPWWRPWCMAWWDSPGWPKPWCPKPWWLSPWWLRLWWARPWWIMDCWWCRLVCWCSWCREGWLSKTLSLWLTSSRFLTCLRSLARRFWNQILTCLSDRPRLAASSAFRLIVI